MKKNSKKFPYKADHTHSYKSWTWYKSKSDYLNKTDEDAEQ